VAASARDAIKNPAAIVRIVDTSPSFFPSRDPNASRTLLSRRQVWILRRVQDVAIVLLVLYGLLALLLPMGVQLARTGSTGIKGLSGQPGSLEWVAGVGFILAMGLIRCTLAVVKGQTPEVSMLFETPGLGSYIIASILFGIMFFIGFILCIIPGIIFAVVYHFYGYVIVENPSTGAIDSLKKAADITRGHRWELFGLFIVLILINIVGLIACLVGVLFTAGISAVAVAYAYRSLSGESVVQPT